MNRRTFLFVCGCVAAGVLPRLSDDQLPTAAEIRHEQFKIKGFYYRYIRGDLDALGGLNG